MVSNLYSIHLFGNKVSLLLGLFNEKNCCFYSDLAPNLKLIIVSKLFFYIPEF